MDTRYAHRQAIAEHFFAEAIRLVNEGTGSHPTITARQAVKLRDAWYDSLKGDNREVQWSQITTEQAAEAVGLTLLTVPGVDEPIFGFGEDIKYTPVFKKTFDSFVSAWNGETFGFPALMVSPYDPEFRNRYTVRRTGTKPLAISMEEVTGSDPASKIVSARRQIKGSFYTLSSVDGHIVEAGSLISGDDRTGMSRLMPYMSTREYSTVSAAVRAGVSGDKGYIDRKLVMSDAAFDRAEAILQFLQESGLEYEVKTDRNPGQIMARVRGHNVSIRLVDTKADERYVGRVYDNGVATYFSTDAVKKVGNRWITQSYEPTPEEAVDLVRYTLGMPVRRFDGEMLGYPSRSLDSKGRLVFDTVHKGPGNGKPYSSVLYKTLPNNARVSLYSAIDRSSTPSLVIDNAESARDALASAIGQARFVFQGQLNVDKIINDFEDHHDDPSWEPTFSGHPDIVAIQRQYWGLLKGENTDTLIAPHIDPDEYRRAVNDAKNRGDDQKLAEIAQVSTYPGTISEQIRQHANDLVDFYIGTDDVREKTMPDGRIEEMRFNPHNVAEFMATTQSVFYNIREIERFMRSSGQTDGRGLIGPPQTITRFIDRLAVFDPDSAKTINDLDPQSVQAMALREVESSLERFGCVVRMSDEIVNGQSVKTPQIYIDDKGIIEWHARKVTGRVFDPLDPMASVTDIKGYIGQVFEIGDNPENLPIITTKFNSGLDFQVIPGYRADIVPGKPGSTLEENTRVRGYEHVMRDSIRSSMFSALRSHSKVVGDTAGLNHIYGAMYCTRMDLNHLDRLRSQGVDEDLIRAVVTDTSHRVRYSNDIGNDASINAVWDQVLGKEYDRHLSDPANDYNRNVLQLTGGRPISLITDDSKGFFDSWATGSSRNQGLTRYLVESATVSEDGRIIPGDKDDTCAIRKQPLARNMDYNPFVRCQMALSNALQMVGVAENVGTAMMSFGGWVGDDAVVISDRLAKRYTIADDKGIQRPLIASDKLSDMHGNKSVIAMVIDTSMTEDEAGELGLDREWRFFKENPTIDMVRSPYTGPSRFNGGTTRTMLEQPIELVNPYDNQIEGVEPGTGGHIDVVIPSMTAEAKNTVYTNSDFLRGRSRKASSQFAWGLQYYGCHDVMNELYGGNDSSLENVSEYLRLVGVGVTPEGTLIDSVGESDRMRSEFFAEHGEDLGVDLSSQRRHMVRLPETLTRRKNGNLHMQPMVNDFINEIAFKGGDLEMPFPISFYGGEICRETSDGTWIAPLLAPHLRSGGEFSEDGSFRSHEYTHAYVSMYKAALIYMDAREKVETMKANGEVGTKAYEEQLRRMRQKPIEAQVAFDSISDDVVSRRLSGKHNVFKESLMSVPQPHSATLVGLPDPRLNLNSVSLGRSTMDSLGVKDGDLVIVFRDPVLHGSNIIALEACADDRLDTGGVAVHPTIHEQLAADNDGDQYGVIAVNTPEAKKELAEKLALENRLTNPAVIDSQGRHPLSFSVGMEYQAAMHAHPELAQRYDDLTTEVNDLTNDKNLKDNDRREKLRDCMDRLNDVIHEAQDYSYGAGCLSFASVEQHMKSIRETCLDTGAKGNEKSVADYARFLGVDPKTYEDSGHSLQTKQDYINSQLTTMIKAEDTGYAGRFSQLSVSYGRTGPLQSILDVTNTITNSVFKAKHNPSEALNRHAVITRSLHSLMRGQLLDRTVKQVPDLAHGGLQDQVMWDCVLDDKGNPVRATQKQWADCLYDMCTDEHGLGVKLSREGIDAMAQAFVKQDGTMLDLMDREEVIEEGRCRDGKLVRSPMDEMAYDGKLSVLRSLSEEQVDLFYGASSDFRPRSIDDNIRARKVVEEKKLDGRVRARIQSHHPAPLPKDISADHAQSFIPKSKFVTTARDHGVENTNAVPRDVSDDYRRSLRDDDSVELADVEVLDPQDQVIMTYLSQVKPISSNTPKTSRRSTKTVTNDSPEL